MTPSLKKGHRFLFFPLLGFLGGLLCSILVAALYYYIGKESPKRSFVSVDEVMSLSGFSPLEEEGFDACYRRDDPEIIIRIKDDEEVVYKNEYAFFSGRGLALHKDGFYASSEFLEELLEVEIEKDRFGNLTVSQETYGPLDLSACEAPFVAHFFGGYYHKDQDGRMTMDKNTYSMEALVSSYEKGYRIFETRFCMTSDGVLVPFYNLKKAYGKVPTYQEFMEESPFGTTQMDLTTLLTQMLVNPDMYLIVSMSPGTDSLEEISERYQILIDTARSLGGEDLLIRIIPEFRTNKERKAIRKIYHFGQMLYLPKLHPPKGLEEDEDSEGAEETEEPEEDDDEEGNQGKEAPEEEIELSPEYLAELEAFEKRLNKVIQYVKKKDDIIGVAFSKDVLSRDYSLKLQEMGKLVFVYTLDRLDYLHLYFNLGAQGFYSNTMPPRGYDTLPIMGP